MSDLRLNLDTIDFKELVELGRSMIPTVAPGWTDHNVHDPGIMLMELVAWLADAQVYSLARSSRGEREAYGHLLGLTLTSGRPAQGLVWPSTADAAPGTLPPWAAGTVVERGTRVIGDRPKAPPFFAGQTIELSRASLTQVASRFANGTMRDWTRANSQQGATFLPFGENPAAGTRLELTVTGLLIGDADTRAPISIGFEIVSSSPARANGDAPDDAVHSCAPVHLSVSLKEAQLSWDVAVRTDTTGGLAHSGVLLLDIDRELAGRTGTFTLSIESAGGTFLLPPRLQRIALNVLPVIQREAVTNEEAPKFGTAMPDQVYTLARSGLVHPLDTDNFKVFLPITSSTLEEWTRIDDVTAAGPDDAVYAVDLASGRIIFGNGINGRMPRAEADLRVEYVVTAGAQGNLPRGVLWTVTGVPAPFGLNSEAMSGGTEPRDLARLRGDARRRVRQSRPIVTSADLQNAALALTDLGVQRAQELMPTVGARRLGGARVLVAVGPHSTQSGTDTFEESAIWLGEIRRRLAPRLPLGQSLDVIGPRLETIHVAARLVALPQRHPDDVRTAVEQRLREKFAVTSNDPAIPVWPFGRDVTALMVKGWLRNVDGVGSVPDVVLKIGNAAEGSATAELGPISLPRLRIDAGDIEIARPPIGGRA
jgi:hypothetical protein